MHQRLSLQPWQILNRIVPGHPGAIPGRITPDGSMYGCLHDFDVMASMFSAAWTRFGDTSLTAGGGALADPSKSYPNSMHGGATPDGNTMVGFYVDMMTSHQHGYILQNGVVQTYDVPGSIQTVIWDINPGLEWWELTRTAPESNTGLCNFRTDQRRSRLMHLAHRHSTQSAPPRWL